MFSRLFVLAGCCFGAGTCTRRSSRLLRVLLDLNQYLTVIYRFWLTKIRCQNFITRGPALRDRTLIDALMFDVCLMRDPWKQ